ncbi:hypothetical protein D3C81_2052640 [compost metagenome]
MLVKLQDMADFLNQVGYIISNALSAKIAEIGQILADLSRIKIQPLSQLLRRNCSDFAFLEIIQKTQVHREPANNGLRYFIRFHVFSS